MTAGLSSPADIVNAAASSLKLPLRVGDLYDGSPLATKALDIYIQARDALMRADDWGFPRGDIALTLLKQAPAFGYTPPTVPWNPITNPPLPYMYEYAYPADCLMLRSIRPTPVFVPNFRPVPYVFEIANDNVPVTGQQTAPGRVILCYCANAIGTYCRQVTDMTQWDVGFTDAFIRELQQRLGPAFEEMNAPGVEQEKTEIAVAQGAAGRAVMRQG